MAVIPVELVVLGIGYIIMMVGIYNSRLRLMKYLGSILVFVISVVLLWPGITGIPRTSLIAITLGTVGIGLGFFFLIEDSFSYDRQVENYDQYDDGRYHDD